MVMASFETVKSQLPPKQGLALTWTVDGLAGVECLWAVDLRHHYGRHSHEAFAIGVIEAGVGGNRCRGADHYSPAGTIVAMNPGEAHTGYSAGEAPLSYRMLYISPSALSAALPEEAAMPYFPDLCIENQRWATHLQRLHGCLEVSPDPLEKQARFLSLMGRFCTCFGGGVHPPRATREPAAVSRIKAYLRAHYAEPVTIDQLAGITQLNRAHLMRSFTRTVGMPPYTYLTQIRVERAKDLLAAGRSPAETALAVGFADQSHLNRHFKKLSGTTPRLYQLGHYRSRN
jgi:AraC-like DNA-binding protein